MTNNYSYIVTNKQTGAEGKRFIFDSLEEDVNGKIRKTLKIDITRKKYRDIMSGYCGDEQSVIYNMPKHFRNDPDLMFQHLMSTISDTDVDEYYSISEINKGPKCQGCLFELCGQNEHTGCGGCLHDSNSCESCCKNH